MSNHMISVITPIFERFDELRPIHASLCMQTLRCSEWIIINDNSNHAYTEKLNTVLLWESPFPIHVFHLDKNLGPADARNIGISAADPMSSYVAFLDSDDYWHPDKLRVSIHTLIHFKADFLYHHCKPLNPLDSLLSRFNKRPRLINGKSFMHIVFNKCTSSCIVFKRSAGIRFPSQRYCEDQAMLLHCIASKRTIVFLPAAYTIKVRKANTLGGLSGNRRQMRAGEMTAIYSSLAANRGDLCFSLSLLLLLVKSHLMSICNKFSSRL